MPKRTSDYHAWLLTRLTDPRTAVNYLNGAIEDSPKMFLKALRNVAEAHKMAKIAEEARRARESLYKTLSEEGNPRLDSLCSILKAMGLRIAVETIDSIGSPSKTLQELDQGQQASQKTPSNLGLSNELQGAQQYFASIQAQAKAIHASH